MPFDVKRFAATVRISDGAWGTELQKKGLPAGGCPELWNDLNPASVEVVARSYAEAGSDVILTNTFGGNRYVLDQHGAADRVSELCEKGAAISKRAAEGTGSKVFGSVGPTGQIVMMGEVSEEALAQAFVESAEALEWGGVDAIVLETFNELDEARIALKAVKQHTSLPVIVSMTFSSGPDQTATMMGNKPADLAKMANKFGADGVGANCGVGPENYTKVARMLRDATDLPIWIKANAGMPQIVNRKTVFPLGPDQYAEHVDRLIDAGANFIGGCCGTTPEHIAAVRAAVDRRTG
ncbi:MAG: homocysteine S-methyltransferase family protein [Phycisphaerae bacterium]